MMMSLLIAMIWILIQINDSSSDEREGISSASQTVCMSGRANVFKCIFA